MNQDDREQLLAKRDELERVLRNDGWQMRKRDRKRIEKKIDRLQAKLSFKNPS